MIKYLIPFLAFNASISYATLTPVPPVRPGVLDAGYVLEQCQARKKFAEVFNKIQDDYQKEINGLEQELRLKEADLHEKQKKLSEKDFIKVRQIFEQRVQEVQGIVDSRRKYLINARGIALGKIEQVLYKVAEKIAKSKGMNLVLFDTQVFFSSPEYQISKDVLEALDKELPMVSFDVSKEDLNSNTGKTDGGS